MNLGNFNLRIGGKVCYFWYLDWEKVSVIGKVRESKVGNEISGVVGVILCGFWDFYFKNIGKLLMGF